MTGVFSPWHWSQRPSVSGGLGYSLMLPSGDGRGVMNMVNRGLSVP
jgi:hypothetical protein